MEWRFQKLASFQPHFSRVDKWEKKLCGTTELLSAALGSRIGYYFSNYTEAADLVCRRYECGQRMDPKTRKGSAAVKGSCVENTPKVNRRQIKREYNK
ncbi:hypothetical protein TNCV_123071 [Trichonephila clavipes]|nr:hypothetical protein TNCV_123071 [Trichonephila clavipes]